MLHIDKNYFPFSDAVAAYIFTESPGNVFVFGCSSYASVPVEQMHQYADKLPASCLAQLRYVVKGRMGFFQQLHNFQNGTESDKDSDNIVAYAIAASASEVFPCFNVPYPEIYAQRLADLYQVLDDIDEKRRIEA